MSEFDKKMELARKTAQHDPRQAALECNSAFSKEATSAAQRFQAKRQAGRYCFQAGNKYYGEAVNRFREAKDYAVNDFDRFCLDREISAVYLRRRELETALQKAETALKGQQDFLDEVDGDVIDQAMLEIGLSHSVLAQAYDALSRSRKPNHVENTDRYVKKARHHFQQAADILGSSSKEALDNLYYWSAAMEQPERWIKATQGALLSGLYLHPVRLVRFLTVAFSQPAHR